MTQMLPGLNELTKLVINWIGPLFNLIISINLFILLWKFYKSNTNKIFIQKYPIHYRLSLEQWW